MSSVWILKYEVLAFSLGDRKVHYDSFKHHRSDFLIFAYLNFRHAIEFMQFSL